MDPLTITTQPLRSTESSEKPTEANPAIDVTSATIENGKENLADMTPAFDDIDHLDEMTEEEKRKRRRQEDTDCCCVYAPYTDDTDVFCLYIMCQWVCDCFRAVGQCTEHCFEGCANCLTECCEGEGCCTCDGADAAGDVAGDGCDGCGDLSGCFECCTACDCSS